MATETLVHCRGLRARRGTFELDVKDWRVPAGSIVGVIGTNGAGKTTLMRLLMGFDAPTNGQVEVLGRHPIKDVVAVREQVGFMSDDMPLFPLRVGRLFNRLSGYYPNWDAELVKNLVERFGIQTGVQVAQLSKGEGTRLRLIVALAHRPRLIVLDEPGTGLDVMGRRLLLEVILEQVQDEGRSVLISSHQVADVQRIADRLLVLHRGQVICEGVTDELVGSTRSLEEAFLEWTASP